MTVQLRPYQATAVQAIRAAYAQGRRAPLLVLPTGGGKTVTFSYVTQSATAKGRRVWLLAHRAELVKQIAGTLARFGCAHQVIAPGPIIRQCQADQFRAYGRTYVQPGATAWVCSVQTLVKRLDKIPAQAVPDIIVVDEAHHLTGGTQWGQVVEAFPHAKLLPVTATPCRLDGKGLGIGAGGFADDLIMGPTMRELIEAGALSRYRIFAPPNALDLSGVKTRAGDYAKDQLAGAVDRPTITGSAVEHYHRLAAGKRAIVFCVSVEHARHVAGEFEGSGVASEFLDGTLDASEREMIIKRFEAGTTLVLTSCDLVSEGFDLPAIEVAILLRPTQSLALYLQQVGRALRTFPGKTEAIILDHVGAVLTHGLPDEDREWSLDGVTKKKRQPKDEPDEDGIDRISTCPKCFTVHMPAPECPSCGHIYPEKARRVEQADGELQELTDDQLDRMRRARRVLQGSAQTVDELMAKMGMSRARAQKIVQAREAKQAQVSAVLNGIELLGGQPYRLLGVTFGDIRRAKPKELAALQLRIGELLKDHAKLSDMRAA